MNVLLKAFIQNEAGTKIKNRHNEKTFEYLGSIELNESYPFPYGFILETTTEDGDNVDCYIFTQTKLRSNTIVECCVIGLLELFENGEMDHKVITVLPGERFDAIDAGLDSIRSFYEKLSKAFKVGDFLSVSAAMEFINLSSDSRGLNP
jgi:inorganic pyrophosphatase